MGKETPTPRTALVTGAARGLGYEIAAAFICNGYRVVINDIDGRSLEQAAVRLNQLGQQVLCAPGDVSSEIDVMEIFGAIANKFRALDVSVHNAGVISTSPVTHYPLELFDWTISSNLTSTFLCSREAAKLMAMHKGGAIINMGSINGQVARLNNSAYCAAKAAIVQFTRVLALELAPLGITANVLSPGSAGGAMAGAHYSDNAEEKILRGDIETWRLGVPAGRLCTGSDVAAAALFLASSGARHITGHVLAVDGGQSLV